MRPRTYRWLALPVESPLGEVPLNNDFSRDDGTFPAAQGVAERLYGLPLFKQAMGADAGLSGYQRIMPALAWRRRSAVRELLADCGLLSEVAAHVERIRPSRLPPGGRLLRVRAGRMPGDLQRRLRRRRVLQNRRRQKGRN